MKPARDFIIGGAAILIFCFGLWCGAKISTAHADRERETAINNAVSIALESSRTPLNCKDNEIINIIKRLAEQGSHIKSYSLYLDVENKPEE